MYDVQMRASCAQACDLFSSSSPVHVWGIGTGRATAERLPTCQKPWRLVSALLCTEHRLKQMLTPRVTAQTWKPIAAAAAPAVSAAGAGPVGGAGGTRKRRKSVARAAAARSAEFLESGSPPPGAAAAGRGRRNRWPPESNPSWHFAAGGKMIAELSCQEAEVRPSARFPQQYARDSQHYSA